MGDMDLRLLGSIMGLPLYVDVSSIPQHSEFTGKDKKITISERDRKAFMVRQILQEAVGMPPQERNDDVTKC